MAVRYTITVDEVASFLPAGSTLLLAVVKTNLPTGAIVVDTGANALHIGDGKVDIGPGGSLSMELLQTDAADTNVSGWSYWLELTYRTHDGAREQRLITKLGPFPVTADGPLAALTGHFDTPAVDPSWRSAFRDEMEDLAADAATDAADVAVAVATVAAADAVATMLSGGRAPVPFAHTMPLTITRNPLGYAASIDLAAMHDEDTGKVIYVDQTNGNNSWNGLTPETAKASIGTAIQDSGAYDVKEVIVLNGGVFNRSGSSFQLGSRTKIRVRAADGHPRPILTQADTTTWTVHSGNCYASASLSGTGTVLDLDAPHSGAGIPIPLTRAASLADCIATPGTSFRDGNTQYVHRANGAAPGTRVLVDRSTYHLNSGAANPGSAYSIMVEGLIFWGGISSRVKGWDNGGDLFLARNCGWHYATDNGTSFQAFDTVLVNCEATHNGVDGFNYHDVEGRTGTAVEIDCRGRLNGISPGSSQNGTTAHDNYKIIRVGGVYEYNPGPNVADVNNVLSANYGVRAGNALGYGGTPDYDFTAPEGTGKTWLFDCASTSERALRNASAAVVSGFQHLGTFQGGDPAPWQ